MGSIAPGGGGRARGRIVATDWFKNWPVTNGPDAAEMVGFLPCSAGILSSSNPPKPSFSLPQDQEAVSPKLNCRGGCVYPLVDQWASCTD